MSAKEVKSEWSGCQLAERKEFVCNTEADVRSLPACSVGSTAIVAETGNIYTMCEDGKWALKGSTKAVHNEVHIDDSKQSETATWSSKKIAEYVAAALSGN